MPGHSGVKMLNEDYRDILSIFKEENVEFLLVGAYALGVHGVPRATGDIDLFVNPRRDNAEKVYKSLMRFGAPLSGITPDDFSAPDLIFQIGLPPRRIDIITSISGITFYEAFSDHITADVDGIQVPVISTMNLIKNKVESAREKDLLDVKILKKHLNIQ